MLKISKITLFISIAILFFSILININDFYNYKDFLSFWNFEYIQFRIGTWYILFFIVGIILFISSLITFLALRKSKKKQ